MVLVISMVFAAPTALASEDLKFSQEYKTSPYYTKLTETLENTKDKSAMERTLAVALSQEGYKNYATAGIDVEQARADGLLWTGKELRMNDNLTGNTEYTRWAERYIMDHDEAASLYDMDWCAIFVSWCLYQAGYNDDERLKRYYYAYCAEPRIEFDADSWILAYNFRQQGVTTPPRLTTSSINTTGIHTTISTSIRLISRISRADLSSSHGTARALTLITLRSLLTMIRTPMC